MFQQRRLNVGKAYQDFNKNIKDEKTRRVELEGWGVIREEVEREEGE